MFSTFGKALTHHIAHVAAILNIAPAVLKLGHHNDGAVIRAEADDLTAGIRKGSQIKSRSVGIADDPAHARL